MSIATVRVVAVVAAVAMAATIAYGFVTGDFTQQGGMLLDLAWGRVTLVDLYLAFGVAWGWIAWREGTVGAAVIWAVLVAILGSLAIWGYVAWRARDADDVPALLLGGHAPRAG